jgi:maltooligosyltrehalose trehalohydrolase
MGQEYGEANPFQFFTDHVDPAIAEATRQGRREEFASFAAFSAQELPDPQARATLERSKLTHRGDESLRRLVSELIALRRELPPAVELDVDEDARILRVRRGPAELVADFRSQTAQLHRD